jgi:hypothetical protein
MEEQIRGGTLDAPSWEVLRIGPLPLNTAGADYLARVAQRLYAPLGTELSLGEYVRLNQRFVDLFAHKKRRTTSSTFTPSVEKAQFNFDNKRDFEGYVQTPPQIQVDEDDADSIDALARDLKVLYLIALGNSRFTRTFSRQRI